MQKTFVIFDEIIQGVVSASDETELVSKIKVLMSSVREPISNIELPSFNDFNDMEEHEFNVIYESDDCESEVFFIQRFNVL